MVIAAVFESCIQHPPLPYVAVRPEYVGIGGDHCSAAVLSVFEHWHNVKLEHQKQARVDNAIAMRGHVQPTQDESLWVYMSQEDMREGLLGLFGEKAIRASLKTLEENGLVATRNNPRFGWDRTVQYLFRAKEVQELVSAWYPAIQAISAFFQNFSAFLASADNAQKCGMSDGDKAQNDGFQAAKMPDRSGKNADAIPDLSSDHSPDHSELNSLFATSDANAPSPHDDPSSHKLPEVVGGAESAKDKISSSQEKPSQTAKDQNKTKKKKVPLKKKKVFRSRLALVNSRPGRACFMRVGSFLRRAHTATG
jgi:hypothetical protein